MTTRMKWILGLSLFAAWVVSTVLLGGMALLIKNRAGINVFSSTGYHAFTHCVIQEYGKARREKIGE